MRQYFNAISAFDHSNSFLEQAVFSVTQYVQKLYFEKNMT